MERLSIRRLGRPSPCPIANFKESPVDQWLFGMNKSRDEVHKRAGKLGGSSGRKFPG